MGTEERPRGSRREVGRLCGTLAIVCALICACVLLALTAPVPALADAGDPQGAGVTINAPCGDALTWSFDSASGTLVIEGTGPMYDWGNSDQVPWYGVRDQVTSVVIGEGVTTVGADAFFGMRYLASAALPLHARLDR